MLGKSQGWWAAFAGVLIAFSIQLGCGSEGTSTGTSSSGSGGATTSSSTTSASGGSAGSGGTATTTCMPGETKSCYDGPEGTEGVGICTAGLATCDADGAAWGPCVGAVTPKEETCDTPDDDDCNGMTNEGGTGCVCVPNETEACYDGPNGTLGVGACTSGMRTCNDQGTGFGPCTGQVLPQAETCNTPDDDDCNGQTNEGGAGCACVPKSMAQCYTGPANTEDVGVCHGGMKTCNDLGTAYGPCVGEVTPQPETCNTPDDDDCNGQTNEGGAGCACAPNSTASCYTGPAGTLGVGVCAAGMRTCNAQGTAYGPCTGEVTPGVESCSTAEDDDCDGQINEGCSCVPNSTVACYTGPAGTLGFGACVAGIKTCDAQGVAYGPCVGEVTPQPESCLTPADDNCNGQINEGCICAPNSSTSCYSGPAGTQGVGACHGGTKTCNAAGTAYGPCTGEVTPVSESCLTAIDDDCDGQVNEGCICTPNASVSCYSGPAGTQGVGACQAGTQTCNAQGTAYGPCVGEVVPQTESCLTPADDDCNGQVNEGCICVPNSAASCYSGPAGTQGVGACKAGTRTCNAQGTGYGPCSGEVLPLAESCLTAVDDDCDGVVNEGCVCTPNTTTSCYTGPVGTVGVGVCQAGTHTCNAQGTGYGPCNGEIVPQTETCTNSLDDDCNGQVNDGCLCTPNSTASCYTGPAGTLGVGACQAGTHTCNAAGTGYGPCAGEVLPQTETCNTPVDDDCNGQVNEGGAGCVCAPNSSTSCYTGPAGTQGVGACHGGTKTCNALGTGYGACVGEVTPVAETCNTPVDDDCDGQTNESGAGCVCTPNSTSSCYTGPAGTLGVGACQSGTHTCNDQGTAFGPCNGEVVPTTETCNTPIDDDCDGQTNESGAGCVCLPSSSTGCYTGPAGTQGVGACVGGTKTCNAQGTAYGSCIGEVTPAPENCATPADDNCNGQANEAAAGCVCAPSSTTSCYTGPAGTQGVGTCTGGTKTCNAQGTGYGACTGEVTPAPENCATPADENCDGQVNEASSGCVCTPSSTTSCYTGPAGTLGVGACIGGTRTCNAQGTGYGACVGEVTPVPETCNTPVDDDCDGQVNESGTGCVCLPNSSTSCYTGPAGTQGVGACVGGTKTCNAQGTAYGPCLGEVTPVPETCNTPVDDNCNGQVNESGVGCVCAPNTTASCYTGPASTQGVGICQAGMGTCNAQGTGYGSCVGQVLPGTETCNDLVDADCTGVVNDSCARYLWGLAPGGVPDDEGFNVAIDGAGNVITGNYFMGSVDMGCGLQVSPGSGETALLTKHLPNGNCIWSVIYGDDTAVRGLATDPQGNIYTTSFFLNDIEFPGVTLTSAGGVDIYVAKYNSNGVFQWGKSFGDAQAQSSIALAVDSQGNVIVFGYFSGTVDFGGGPLTSAGALDVLIAKLDTNGNHVWSKKFGDGNVQLGNAIAVDSSNNVLIAGGFVGTVNFGGTNLTSAGLGDIFVAKLAPNGTHLWSKKFGDNADQSGRGIAADSAGNVILTGNFAGTVNFGNGNITTQGGTDAFLVKFDAAGNPLWSKGFGGPSSQSGVAVAIDSLGNIGLTGGLDGSADFGGGVLTSSAGTDLYVAKYNPAGTHLWSRRFGGPANQVPRAIAVDQPGNWYVSGFMTGPMDLYGNTLVGAGGEDLFVIKLSP